MIKFTIRLSFAFSMLLISSLAMAQAPFYAEDFAGGIPADWSNEDVSGNMADWLYCSDPSTCAPGTFVNSDGEQLFGNFGAATADNGYVYIDSDAIGELDSAHVSQLTTGPIDASAQEEVYLRFQSQIATFTLNPEANAILKVKIGANGEWTPFTIYNGLGEDNTAQVSGNPVMTNIDLTSVAAMADSVYLQWEWTGNFEFSWAIDDVMLFSALPGNEPEGSVYYEDFADGLEGWEVNTVESGDATESWVYYPVPDVGNGAFAAEGTIIQSLTPDNGAMAVNYDFVNTDGDAANAPAFPYPDIIAELISPVIDLSDVDQQLAIEFNQLIRLLNSAQGNFYSSFSVSRDGGLTYDDPIDVNPTVEPNAAPVNNRVYFPISNAAGEDSLRIKFTFAGDFYYWMIDDITLSPRPDNDIRVNENFFAVAPNFATPKSQVEPINFLVDVENVGGLTQENVEVTVNIETQDGEEVFNSTEAYGSISSDSIAENRIFNEQFTPSDEETEVYLGTYTVTADSLDANTENNEIDFAFVVTDTTFTKDNGATGGIAPGADDSYTYGNVFFVPNGQGNYARYLSFSVSNADALAAADKSVTTLLYKWDGTGGSELEISEEDLEVVAFNSYTFDGSEEGLITLPVDLDGTAIELEDNTYYIPAVQYMTDDEETMFISVSRDFDYQAAWFLTDSLGMGRFGSALDVGNTGSLGLVGFGFGVVPIVRLHIGDNPDITQPGITSTQVVLPADNKVAIFPNPVNDNLQVGVDLTNNTDKLLVKIFDATGKQVMNRYYENVQRDNFNYNVKNLSVGTYFLQVITDAGVRTERFAVQR